MCEIPTSAHMMPLFVVAQELHIKLDIAEEQARYWSGAPALTSRCGWLLST